LIFYFYFRPQMDDPGVPEVSHEVEITATSSLLTPPAPAPHVFGRHLSGNLAVSDLLAVDPQAFSTVQQCLIAAKASGTVSAYSTALRRFEDFCSEHSFPYPGFPSEAILLYIVQLVRLGVSYQVFANFKPSITYLERTAAASASPAKKAPAVTPDMLHIVLDKFYTPFARSVAEIPPARFRTLFRIVLEYHTLCRLNCFRQLQAKHFDIVGDSIMITFPSAKNDQFHQGRSSFLVPTSTPYCRSQETALL
jgi:hypothetical protein